MDRGLQAWWSKLPTGADKDIGTILKTVGMTLVSTVGGASGPLYGTLFLQLGMALAGRDELTPDELGRGARGRARGHYGARQGAARRQDHGRRPAAGHRRAQGGAVAEGADFAAALRRVGRGSRGRYEGDHPAAWPRKGRASYLGERSVGHQDPGATS